MKKLAYYFLFAMLLLACSEEVSTFDANVDKNGFSYEPVMGGAELTYTLPNDPEVLAINVRYKDAYGNDMLKTASNSTNKVVLTGFNEAVSDVKAQVTFVRRDNVESRPIEISFSTLDSAPICFLNNAEVKSGWSGCTLEYENPEGTTGMAHVFYLGINPIDNKPDTILLESFSLIEGHDVRHYTPQQKYAYNTIVVRAEDNRGNLVKERIWNDIQAFNVERLDPKNFDVIYSNSLEIPEEKVGLKYLTDGDTKGTTWFEDQNPFMYHTFISKENGAGPDSEPMYIDLKKMRPVSEVRFYAMRWIGSGKPNLSNFSYQAPNYIRNSWANMLPCAVTIYGCREEVGGNLQNANWEKLASFEENPEADYYDRWTYKAATCGGTSLGRNTFATLKKMEAADGIYKSLPIDIGLQKEGFRYLKIKFDNVFQLVDESSNTTNLKTRYLSFHELEVFSEKEE